MIPDTLKLIGNSSRVRNSARRSLSLLVVCVLRGQTLTVDLFFPSINILWKSLNESVNPFPYGNAKIPASDLLELTLEERSHQSHRPDISLHVQDMVGARGRNGSQGNISEAAMLVLGFAGSLRVCHGHKAWKGERNYRVVKGSEITKPLGHLEMGILMSFDEGKALGIKGTCPLHPGPFCRQVCLQHAELATLPHSFPDDIQQGDGQNSQQASSLWWNKQAPLRFQPTVPPSVSWFNQLYQSRCWILKLGRKEKLPTSQVKWEANLACLSAQSPWLCARWCAGSSAVHKPKWRDTSSTCNLIESYYHIVINALGKRHRVTGERGSWVRVSLGVFFFFF